MSTEEWNGIQEGKLDNVMTDIIDYAEKSNKILTQISDLVEDTSTYFVGENGDKFREKFKNTQVDISIMNKSILSYNTDFLNVKKNYQNRVDVASSIMEQGKSSVG